VTEKKHGESNGSNGGSGERQSNDNANAKNLLNSRKLMEYMDMMREAVTKADGSEVLVTTTLIGSIAADPLHVAVMFANNPNTLKMFLCLALVGVREAVGYNRFEQMVRDPNKLVDHYTQLCNKIERDVMEGGDTWQQ